MKKKKNSQIYQYGKKLTCLVNDKRLDVACFDGLSIWFDEVPPLQLNLPFHVFELLVRLCVVAVTIECIFNMHDNRRIYVDVCLCVCVNEWENKRNKSSKWKFPPQNQKKLHESEEKKNRKCIRKKERKKTIGRKKNIMKWK